MNEELIKKIDHSIERLQKAERLALLMQPDFGFHLSFSGGKDSQCVMELAKMAGVKFKAVYNVTTNDPAANVRFIKEHYPEVEFDIPERSFLQELQNNGLPMMHRRWCCRIYKEDKAKRCVVLTGVRAEESKKRAGYAEFERSAKRKETRGPRDLDAMEDNQFQCVKGYDKFVLHPILAWTEVDVWHFIHNRNIPVNPCYNSGHRVGCIYCCYSDKEKLNRYIKEKPKLYQAMLHSLQIYLDKDPNTRVFKTAEEAFDWWRSKQSIEDYLKHKAKKQQ